ncbi:hypothetical protein JCM11641_006729 [Rhodosporidiobolus odoratus]
MTSHAVPVEIPPHLAKQASTSGGRLLEIERSKASFAPEDLTLYLYGQEYLDRRKRVLAVLEAEPAFDKSRLHYLSRTDKYKAGLRKDKRLVQLTRELGWNGEDVKVAEEMLDFPSAFGLHSTMFMKTLRAQTTDEQKKLFLEPAERFEIIGCYAQTEIAHGSNVQGLETTATYDPETKEFVLQSPSLTAMKWWIGGLGRTADHAVVMAQLMTPDGKDGALVKRGPFPFIVPVRDGKTRELLPGRTIMDIGPKAGYAATDNGCMLLDNVRIPHVNFLAKFAQVDLMSGGFTKPPHDKLSYGTMVFIRAGIVQQARMILARSATVAIRYCAIRRQFADRDAPVTDDGRKPAETSVLNYQLVQARVFPPLVQALAVHYTAREMMRLYEANNEAMEEGNFDMLADVHASSSGLKSLCTIMAAGAIEECRRTCGGHGFSLAGGLASLWQNYLPQVTWEGDSYMLTQQTGRYLFKTMRQLIANPSAPISAENRTADYLKKYIANPKAKAAFEYSGALSDPQLFVEAFGHRAAYLTATALRKRDVEKKSWNSLLCDIFRASTAHSQYLLVYNFAQAITADPALQHNIALHKILTLCFELFATHTMDSEAAEFLSSGYLSPKQHELLRKRLHALLADIRPQAVPLVDALGVPDFLLNSALGRSDGAFLLFLPQLYTVFYPNVDYDALPQLVHGMMPDLLAIACTGDVYPSLVRFAQQEPLNRTRFNVDIDDEELEVGPESGGRAWAKL